MSTLLLQKDTKLTQRANPKAEEVNTSKLQASHHLSPTVSLRTTITIHSTPVRSTKDSRCQNTLIKATSQATAHPTHLIIPTTNTSTQICTKDTMEMQYMATRHLSIPSTSPTATLPLSLTSKTKTTPNLTFSTVRT
jgi:hypothetical protein